MPASFFNEEIMAKQSSLRGGKTASQRQLRVGEVLRHELAQLFLHDEIREPALKGVIITVSEVSVSPDLRKARAYIMPLGGKNQQLVVEALNRSQKFLRGELSRKLSLKYSPEIEFVIDRSFDYSQRIDQVLNAPEVARDILSDDGTA